MEKGKPIKKVEDKVLRIGIVQGGTIITEKLIKRGQNVTIGEHKSNTLTVPSKKIPKKFPLFSTSHGRFCLNFLDNIEGKILVNGRPLSLQELKNEKEIIKKEGGIFSYPLSEANRGKIGIEDIIILFQFSNLPPEPERPKIPKEFRRNLIQEIDPYFAAFFIVSLVIHLTIYLYVNSLPEKKEFDIKLLQDRFVKIAVKQEDIDKMLGKEPEAEGEGIGKEKEEENIREEKKGTGGEKKELTEAERIAAEQRRQEKMKKKAYSKGLLAMIGTTGESRGDFSVEDLLGDGSLDGDLDSVMNSVRGTGLMVAQRGADGIPLYREGGGGGKGVGIGDLGKAGGGKVDTGVKKIVQVKGKATVSTPEMFGGCSYEGIGKIIQNNLGYLQYCYNTALKRNTNLQGSLKVKMVITEDGSVEDVEILVDTIGDANMQKCILNRLSRLKFPPCDRKGEIRYPFLFTPIQ